MTICVLTNIVVRTLITPVPKISPPKKIETDFRQISVLPQLAKVLKKRFNCN